MQNNEQARQKEEAKGNLIQKKISFSGWSLP